ncbi:cytochrome P450 monooxygenase-like protein [Phaeosphaeria sp. MPI-PUGE-AT-0046c]|nr:cytochrome P450 monooxygenase-like protein [Phaeosphaeria sp. MPI-PUGE-AT-0046c]
MFTALFFLLPLVLFLRFITTSLRNPLCKVPAAHRLAHYTSLWIASIRWRSIENTTLKEAHARLGPIICLGPNEISVNCVKGGIREIYTGGFPKGSTTTSGGYNWYAFFTNYGGVHNMFSTGENKAHSMRKRMISNIYSKSVVNSSPALLAQVSTILYKRFLPYLDRAWSHDKGVLNIYALLNATTMDIVTAYIFGLEASSNFIEYEEKLAWFLGVYTSRHGYSFWPQEFPNFSSFVEKWLGYRFAPKFVDAANEEIEKWTQSMCETASSVMTKGAPEPEDLPVVYQQLTTALLKDAKSSNVKSPNLAPVLASEVLDHLAAGFDTSGITLNYVVHELSQHKDIQSRLMAELQSLAPRVVSESAPTLSDPKAIDALPLLHAVIWETLRLHSAIPGPQPRFTPAQGCRLGPEEKSYFVPGNTRVSASAGLLHTNEEVYECASEWRPERWLELEKLDEERRKDMESRWFWAFGRLVTSDLR